MIDGCDSGRQSSMNTKNTSFNDGCDWQIVENFCKIVPDIVISVFFPYFIIESVDEGNCTGLVVSSE